MVKIYNLNYLEISREFSANRPSDPWKHEKEEGEVAIFFQVVQGNRSLFGYSEIFRPLGLLHAAEMVKVQWKDGAKRSNSSWTVAPVLVTMTEEGERKVDPRTGKKWPPLILPSDRYGDAEIGKDVDGSPILLHYRLFGTGESKVLFVMGFATSCAAWIPQIEYFSEHHPTDYEMCVFDNRGIGRSSTPQGRYTTSLLAQDALNLANYLGWKQFHLVGISMGGMISLELAALAPQRILSLFLAVTHAGGLSAYVPLKGFAMMMKTIGISDPYERARSNMRIIYSDRWCQQKRPDGTTNLEKVVELYVKRW
jgi:hypothetical protein